MVEREFTHERILNGRIAVVTGAAQGIGRGIALSMSREGATVVLADIDQEGMEETRDQILLAHGDALVVPTDISDTEQNDRLVDATLAEYGNIDILVNNAGINTPGGILDIDSSAASTVIATNLTGPLYLTQRVAREMTERGIKGSILFTSSTHSHITALTPAYSASKAGIEMLVKECALELAEYGIRVNAVAPGAIAVRGEAERMSPHVPMGFLGTPEDIANAMVFLASDKANYITGQTLVVDGGFSLAHTHYWGKKGKL